MTDPESYKFSAVEELIELPTAEWSALRNLFQLDWPKHTLAFNTLYNYEHLVSRKRACNARVWVLNGDCSDGTFLLQDCAQLFVYTLDETGERLQRALSLFSWIKGPRLSPYDDRHKDVVTKSLRDLGVQFEYHVPTKMFWIAKEKAQQQQLEVPEEVMVGPLRPEHAEIANALWPYIFDGSNLFLRGLIERNPSRGVYGVEDHQLRAWAIRLDNGMLAALHTHPMHLRKGYGSLVLTAMSKANADQGSDTIACVIGGNQPTLGLLQKAGFQEIGPVNFAKTKPL